VEAPGETASAVWKMRKLQAKRPRNEPPDGLFVFTGTLAGAPFASCRRPFRHSPARRCAKWPFWAHRAPPRASAKSGVKMVARLVFRHRSTHGAQGFPCFSDPGCESSMRRKCTTALPRKASYDFQASRARKSYAANEATQLPCEASGDFQ
jgi:hypothetical protein